MLLILVAFALGRDSRTDARDLNARVVAFARSNLGHAVGGGICVDLAREALRQAGARLPGRGQYGWGEPLPTLNGVRAGDLLQFEGAVFVHNELRADGALVTLTYSYPSHVAIVAAVRKHGPKPVLVILHQNAGIAGGDDADRKVVQEWTIRLAEKVRGTVTAYRPIAADQERRAGLPDPPRDGEPAPKTTRGDR